METKAGQRTLVRFEESGVIRYLCYTFGHRGILGTVEAEDLFKALHYCWFQTQWSDDRFTLEHVLTKRKVTINDQILKIAADGSEATEFTVTNESIATTAHAKTYISLRSNLDRVEFEPVIGPIPAIARLIDYITPPKAGSQVVTGGVYLLPLTEIHAFLGLQDGKCTFSDVRIAASLWSFLSTDVSCGSQVSYNRSYFLKNLSTNSLLTATLTLTDKVSEAAAFLVSGRSDGQPLSIRSKFILIGPNGELKFTTTLSDSASMKLIFPKEYASETITHFIVSTESTDKVAVFEVECWRECSQRRLLQVIALRDRIDTDNTDLNNECANMEFSQCTDFCLDILRDIQFHADCLKAVHSKSTLGQLPLYTLLSIPVKLADLFLLVQDRSTTIAHRNVIAEISERTYPAVFSSLYEALRFSHSARLQSNARSAAIVQHLFSQPDIPQLFGLIQTVLSPSIDLEGMVVSLRSWWELLAVVTTANVGVQSTAMSVLGLLLGTSFRSRREWDQYEAVMSAGSPVLQYHFFEKENGVHLAFSWQSGGMGRTVSIENPSEDSQRPPEISTYIAKYIDFLTAVDKASQNQARFSLFREVNLTDERLASLVESKADVRVRSAALRNLTERLQLSASIDLSILLRYTQQSDSEVASLSLSLESVNSLLHRDLPLGEAEGRVEFGIALLNYARVAFVCTRALCLGRLLDAVIDVLQCDKASNVWLVWDVEALRTAPCVTSRVLIREIVSAAINLLEAGISSEEVMAAKGTLESSAISHSKALPALFRGMILCAELKIEVVDSWKRVLLRAAHPEKAIFTVRKSLGDYEKAAAVKVIEIMRPNDYVRESILTIGHSDNLRKTAAAVNAKIGKIVALLEDPHLRLHYQTVFRETRLYVFYLHYWVQVYSRIYKQSTSDDENAQPLYSLGSGLFRLFTAFIASNAHNKALIRIRLNPLLYYLGIVEEAELIKELCDFTHYSAETVPNLLSHISKVYIPNSVKGGAYGWLEEMIVNKDGSFKREIQERVFATLMPVWTPQASNSVPALRLIALCCANNEGVRCRCVQAVTIDELERMYKSKKTTESLEAALLAVALIYDPRNCVDSQRVSVTGLLSAAQSTIQSLLAAPGLSSVLQSGLYSLSHAPKKVRFSALYGSDAEREIISKLRLVCSGPSSMSGVANLIPTLLRFVKESLADKAAGQWRKLMEKLSQQIGDRESPIGKSLTKCIDFLRNKKSAKENTSDNEKIHRETPTDAIAFNAFAGLISANICHPRLPLLLERIFEGESWTAHLSACLKQYALSITDPAAISPLLDSVLRTLGQTLDPKACDFLWDSLAHVLANPEFLVLTDERTVSQLKSVTEAWLNMSIAIQTRISILKSDRNEHYSIVQSMKLTRLVDSHKYKREIDRFASVFSKAVSTLSERLPGIQGLEAAQCLLSH